MAVMEATLSGDMLSKILEKPLSTDQMIEVAKVLAIRELTEQVSKVSEYISDLKPVRVFSP